MMRFNVKNFGAIADGKTLDTAAFQMAVDTCAKTGGGEVFVPVGEYVLSTVFLKEGVHIRFEDGTRVLGSLNFYDYAQQEQIDYPLYQDASHSYFDLSMFVGKNCKNVALVGKAVIDMRSVWDEDGVRGEAIVHRGPKCIALKECDNVEIGNLEIYNVTDLAIYFAGCNNVDIYGIKMRVYIDGISPDNSKNVRIHDCEMETGDDGIVFKSSYTLNRLDICKDIHVWDCKIKSRCSALKFGTETNGGFEDILIENIHICDTRITGLAIESVDGAIIDGITVRNVVMRNVGAPLFIHVGKRMRGPEGREIGRIRNVTIENLTATGPYEPYEIVSWNYYSYKANDTYQEPWDINFGYAAGDKADKDAAWQITSNVCGLEGYPLENIILRNVTLNLDGGVQEPVPEVPQDPKPYPEVNIYGRFLPAKGLFFRDIEGLTMENVRVTVDKSDIREDFVFDRVNNLKILP